MSLLVAFAVAASLFVSPAVAHAADDYPYPTASSSGVDPWGFYNRYCTSFVAWRMNRNAGPMSFVNYMNGGHWGNAGNWGANARTLGYPVNNTPAVGAIAWWATGVGSALGHVAYVEAINTDGTVVIEEYNYGVKLVHNRRTINASDVSGYIHFHDVAPPRIVPPVITLSCVRDAAVYGSAITPTFVATGTGLRAVTATLNGSPFLSGALVEAPGSYTLTVSATDASSNQASKTAVFTIDPEASDPDVAFTAIAGVDRYETSARMSRAAFDLSECVILATGENWPDALGGAALAGALEAPILLTRRGSLPPSVLAEIDRLGATSAVILGGPAAVGSDVEAALRRDLGTDAVERIGGDDRYKTAEAIAREVVAAEGEAYDGTCFVATGSDFPDALAASPLSTARRWPLLLTSHKGLSESTAVTLGELGATRAVVLGGCGVIPESIEAGLITRFGKDRVTRLGGANRYGTAALVAEYATTEGMHWDGVALATGQNFPDALAGGALQGQRGSVMLLTPTASLVSEARNQLVAHRSEIRTVRFLGGEGAVCSGARQAAAQALD